MGKTIALLLASFAVVAFGCSSSLGLPNDDDGLAKALSTTASTDDTCTKLTAKSGTCGWSQRATVGCSTALLGATLDLTSALDACLAEESCDEARACLDAALVGASTPAADDGGADAAADAPPVIAPDDAATAPDTSTPTGPTAPATCAHSVNFADATCKSCMDTSCCGQSAICGKSQACLDLLTCVADCDDGDLTCEASCKSIRASATIAAFDDLRSCRTTSCASTCPTF